MKVTISLVLVLIVIGILVWLGWQKIGNVTPAVLPSASNIADEFEQKTQSLGPVGEEVDLPLQVPENLKVGLFARDLGKARGMAFSPEGVLLVSDMDRSGEIYALPDVNEDGIADTKKVVLTDLLNTHGFTFYKNKLYVTEETKVSRYNWDGQNLQATLDKKLFDLPDPGGHFTRTIKFDSQGTMYVSLGSSCNVCEEKEPFFAAVIVSDADGTTPQVFAKGLRNSVAMAVDPVTQKLWSADNGRDLVGDNIPPEEVNILQQGQDYGWPYCYGERVPDTSYSQEAIAKCPATEPMVYGMPAHNAPLGMAFMPNNFVSEWEGDLVVGLHGSWNRSVPDGFKVVRLVRDGDKVIGMEDLLTGFIKGWNVDGRPVDVIFDEMGNLFVSDDKAGNIYIINRK